MDIYTCLSITNNNTYDYAEIAKAFSKYIPSMGKQLGNNTRSTNIDPEVHLGDQVTHSTFLAPTSPILKEIMYETSYPLSPLIKKTVRKWICSEVNASHEQLLQ